MLNKICGPINKLSKLELNKFIFLVNYVYVTSIESATSTCVVVRRPSTSFREIQKIRATPLAVFIFSTDSLFMLFSPSLSVFTFYVSNEIWCCVLWSFFLEKDGLSTKRRGFHDQLFQNLVIWHFSSFKKILKLPKIFKF